MQTVNYKASIMQIDYEHIWYIVMIFCRPFMQKLLNVRFTWDILYSLSTIFYCFVRYSRKNRTQHGRTNVRWATVTPRSSRPARAGLELLITLQVEGAQKSRRFSAVGQQHPVLRLAMLRQRHSYVALLRAPHCVDDGVVNEQRPDTQAVAQAIRGEALGCKGKCGRSCCRKVI